MYGGVIPEISIPHEVIPLEFLDVQNQESHQSNCCDTAVHHISTSAS